MVKSHYSKKGIVALCTLAYFASYFSRKTFAVVMANMLEDGVITKEIGGYIGAALFIFYGLGQLVSGFLGDRLQPKKLMFTGLMLSALCNLLLPLMPSGALMIPIWAINGFAQALLWPPIVRILADNLSHEQYVTANLVVTCGAHVSTIVLYLYAPLCIRIMSYKLVFFTSTVFCIVAGIIFIATMSIVLPRKPLIFVRKAKKIDTGSEKSLEGIKLSKLFASSGVLPIFVCIIAMGFMRDGIESWLPTLYMEVFNKSSESSILISVALPIFSIISIFVVRAIHKGKTFNNEVRGSLILFGASAILCVPLAFLINSKGNIYQIFCLLIACVVCAFMHSCNFLLISCVPGRFAKTGRASTVSGFCNACTYIGAAVSMYGIAYVSKLFGWSATICSWIGVCLLGVAFALFAINKYSKFLKH